MLHYKEFLHTQFIFLRKKIEKLSQHTPIANPVLPVSSISSTIKYPRGQKKYVHFIHFIAHERLKKSSKEDCVCFIFHVGQT